MSLSSRLRRYVNCKAEFVQVSTFFTNTFFFTGNFCLIKKVEIKTFVISVLKVVLGGLSFFDFQFLN